MENWGDVIYLVWQTAEYTGAQSKYTQRGRRQYITTTASLSMLELKVDGQMEDIRFVHKWQWTPKSFQNPNCIISLETLDNL